MSGSKIPIDKQTFLKLLRASFAEFVATLFFVFIGTGSVSASVYAAEGGAFQPVGLSLAFGLAITVLAFCIGDVSGGHMNPAVTLSLAISKNIRWTRCFLYILAQFFGSICGAGLLRLAVGKEYYVSGLPVELDISQAGVFILEFMGTSFLLFTVFHVAVWASKQSDLSSNATDLSTQISTTAAVAPIPIGFAVAIAHLTIAKFTGCGINPARAFGSAIYVDPINDGLPSHHWIYWLAPFAASLVVPLVYWALYGSFMASEVIRQEKAKGQGQNANDVF